MRVRGGRWGGVHVTPPPVYRRIAPAPAPHTAGAGRGGRDVRHHRHGLLPRAVRRRAGGRAATCHEFGEALEPRQGRAWGRGKWAGPLPTHFPLLAHPGTLVSTQACWRGWATRPPSTSTCTPTWTRPASRAQARPAVCCLAEYSGARTAPGPSSVPLRLMLWAWTWGWRG